MAGLLDGLEQFGLGNLKDINLFEEAKVSESEQKIPIVIKEEDFLFEKIYTCPLCDSQVKTKTVKNGKVKLLGSDIDLRPKYDGIEMMKYDVVACQSCGYAALTRYFNGLLNSQAKLVKEKITASFKGVSEITTSISFEQAIERYQLALANAIVKQGKASEKAYICLKTGWLCRSQRDLLDTKEEGYGAKNAELELTEEHYLRNALDGFIAGIQKESFPMCGMDEATVEYLIAALAMNAGRYEVSSKMVTGLIVRTGVTTRMKDKARDLKEILIQKMKESKK